jgi:hypothetical protein
VKILQVFVSVLLRLIAIGKTDVARTAGHRRVRRRVTNPSVFNCKLAATPVADIARSLGTAHYTELPGTKQKRSRKGVCRSVSWHEVAGEKL